MGAVESSSSTTLCAQGLPLAKNLDASVIDIDIAEPRKVVREPSTVSLSDGVADETMNSELDIGSIQFSPQTQGFSYVEVSPSGTLKLGPPLVGPLEEAQYVAPKNGRPNEAEGKR